MKYCEVLTPIVNNFITFKSASLIVAANTRQHFASYQIEHEKSNPLLSLHALAGL